MIIDYISLIAAENMKSYDTTHFIFSILFLILINIITIFFVFYNQEKKRKKTSYEPIIGDSDKEIKKYLPNMTEKSLIDVLYNKFVEIEKAYMNFDYATLEKDCTDELYESYKLDLDNLKSKGNQNIVDGFECVEYNINSISEENGMIIIKMYLHIKLYKYTLFKESKEVIDGDYQKKIHKRYQLSFVTKHLNEETICPSCGSNLKKGQSECDYCHTFINNNYTDYVLSSKKEPY